MDVEYIVDLCSIRIDAPENATKEELIIIAVAELKLKAKENLIEIENIERE